MPGSRGAVRESAGLGSVGERRGEGPGEGGGGRLLRPGECGRDAGCRPEGAGGAGLSPGSGGRKGSHPSRPPGLPSPRPAPRAGGGPGRRRGSGSWSRSRAPGCAGVSVCGSGGRACPSARASTSCFAGRRRRGHFAAGGGRGAALLARRASGGPEERGLLVAPRALPATGFSPRPRPGAGSGRGAPDPRFSSLSVSALG